MHNATETFSQNKQRIFLTHDVLLAGAIVVYQQGRQVDVRIVGDAVRGNDLDELGARVLDGQLLETGGQQLAPCKRQRAVDE